MDSCRGTSLEPGVKNSILRVLHHPSPGLVTVKSRSIVAALAGGAKVPARIMPMAPAESTPLSEVFIVQSSSSGMLA